MNELMVNIFPDEQAIPERFRIPEPIEQREYLINGEMKTWQGNLNPVLSPVFVKKWQWLHSKSHRQHTITHHQGIPGSA